MLLKSKSVNEGMEAVEGGTKGDSDGGSDPADQLSRVIDEKAIKLKYKAAIQRFNSSPKEVQ